MNARHTLFATVLVPLSLAIAGCGNKGPLVLAEEPAPIEDPATPAGAVPVDLERQQTLPADPPVDVLPDPIGTESSIGTPAAGDPIPPTAEPAQADDPENEAGTPAFDKRIPIDPATVPDSPPATGTADDGDG